MIVCMYMCLFLLFGLSLSWLSLDRGYYYSMVRKSTKKKKNIFTLYMVANATDFSRELERVQALSTPAVISELKQNDENVSTMRDRYELDRALVSNRLRREQRKQPGVSKRQIVFGLRKLLPTISDLQHAHVLNELYARNITFDPLSDRKVHDVLLARDVILSGVEIQKTEFSSPSYLMENITAVVEMVRNPTNLHSKIDNLEFNRTISTNEAKIDMLLQKLQNATSFDEIVKLSRQVDRSTLIALLRQKNIAPLIPAASSQLELAIVLADAILIERNNESNENIGTLEQGTEKRVWMKPYAIEINLWQQIVQKVGLQLSSTVVTCENIFNRVLKRSLWALEHPGQFSDAAFPYLHGQAIRTVVAAVCSFNSIILQLMHGLGVWAGCGIFPSSHTLLMCAAFSLYSKGGLPSFLIGLVFSRIILSLIAPKSSYRNIPSSAANGTIQHSLT